MLYFAGFRQTQPGLPNHRMSTRIRSPHVILKSPQLRFKLEKKLLLIEDRGQTDRVTTKQQTDEHDQSYYLSH